MSDETPRPPIALSEDQRVVDYIARLEQANADLLAQGLAEREQHAASARIWRRVCTALTVLVVLAALEPVWARVVGL